MSPNEEGMIVGGVTATIIGAVVAGVTRIMKQGHDNSEATGKRSLDEAFRLLAVKDTEIAEGRTERHELRNQMNGITLSHGVCEVKLARSEEKLAAANARIAALESFLADHGFVPQTAGTGSKQHAALPPDPPPGKGG